jgi:hypothetical protein
VALLSLLLACSSSRGGDEGPGAEPGRDTASDLRTDDAWTLGEVRTCDVPQPEATWAEATTGWASTYDATPPTTHDGRNPGPLLVVPGGADWLLAWVEPSGMATHLLRSGVTQRNQTVGTPRGLSHGDLDGDGRRDLVMALGTPIVVWGGAEPDLPPERGNAVQLGAMRTRASAVDAAPADLDQDGDLDLLVAWSAPDHEDRHLMRGEFLRNDGAGGFTAEAIDADDEIWGPAFDFSVRDINGDGHLDAYLCNDMGFQVAPNRVLLGDGEGGLTARTGDGLDKRLSCMGSSWADVDADGALELYIAESIQHLLMKRAPDDTWYEVGATLGLGGVFARRYMIWGSSLVDMDNDGRMELLAGTGDFWVEDAQPNAPWWYEQDASGAFVEVGAARGFPPAAHARGVVTQDLNDDGVVDLVMSDAARTPWVYLSEGCTADAWLEVDAPTGSEVLVEAGGVRRAARIDTESGWGSTGPARAHLGLADAEIVDRVTLILPGGARRVLAGPLEPRRRLTYTP